MEWRLERGSAVAADDAIAELFRSDPHRSPFASPSCLAALARAARARGAEPVFVRAEANGLTRALWPLVREGGTLRLLQGEICDHGTCLAVPELPSSGLGEGLALALDRLRPSAVFLGNVPQWGPTLEAAHAGLRGAGWRTRSFAAAVDPVLREAAGPELADALRAHVSGKSLRNLHNRLKREPGFAFEAREDADDIAEWVEEFCDCHDWRWATTATASEFRSPAARLEFRSLLEAWAAEGVLVRFALRVETGRIALAVGLNAPDRLVYHRIAHSPDYEKSSPATVLIRNIALWMGERAVNTLDFGVGAESYKLRFANGEEPLYRVFGAPSAASPWLLRAAVERRIRGSARLQSVWDEWVNRRLRGVLLERVTRARIAIRRRREPAPAPPMLYTASGRDADPDPAVVALPMADALALHEAVRGVTNAERVGFYELRSDGAVPYGILGEEGALHVAWLRSAKPDDALGEATHVIENTTARPAAGTETAQRVFEALRAHAGPRASVAGRVADPETAAALEAAGFERS